MVQHRIEDMDPEVWEALKADTPRTMKIEDRLEEVLRDYYDV